jgi:hypothetical protein
MYDRKYFSFRMKSQIALLFGLALAVALVGSSPIAENKIEEASQNRQSEGAPESEERSMEEEHQSDEDDDDDDRIIEEEDSEIRQSAEFLENKDRIIKEESLLRQSVEDSDDDDRIMKEGID